MKGLHLRYLRSHSIICRVGSCAALLTLAAFVLTSGARVCAQETTLPTAPVANTINFRERPKVGADPQRMRRSPKIDGILSEGEWDVFYTTSGATPATVFCNWDDDYLYIAVKAPMPGGVLVDLDSAGDGWLRGADNLEVVVGSVPEAGVKNTVAARLLDAANSKDAPTWNDKNLDVSLIQTATKTNASGQVTEIAIPKNMGSLVLRSGATIGLRVELLPPGPASAYVPTQPFEPHLLLDATLVDSRAASIPGVNPRLTISDNKCIAGQKLFATLEILNQTDLNIPVQAVLWTGLGNSQNAVNTVREVSVPALPAGKRLKRTYKTVLPENLSPGSYTLTVITDLGNNRQSTASAAFTVVEAIQAQMFSDPDPVAVVGPTTFDVGVSVYSAVPDHARTDVELVTVPTGWQLQGGIKHGLTVEKEDGTAETRFTFHLPSTTPTGDYPLEATVKWNNRIWHVKHTAHVTRPDPVLPKKPE